MVVGRVCRDSDAAACRELSRGRCGRESGGGLLMVVAVGVVAVVVKKAGAFGWVEVGGADRMAGCAWGGVGSGAVQALEEGASAGGAVGFSRGVGRAGSGLAQFGGAGCGGQAVEGDFCDVAAVRLKDELDLADEKAEVAGIDRVGKQELQLVSQAVLERVLSLVEGLLYFGKLNHGL